MSDDDKTEAEEKARELMEAVGKLCRSMQAPAQYIAGVGGWLLMEGLEQLADESTSGAVVIANAVKEGLEEFIKRGGGEVDWKALAARLRAEGKAP